MKFEIIQNDHTATIITINPSAPVLNVRKAVPGEKQDNVYPDIITFDSVNIILEKTIKGILKIENTISDELSLCYEKIGGESMSFDINNSVTVLQLEAGLYKLSVQQKRSGISDTKNQPLSYLKGHDIEKIYFAKKILEQNIQTPCSLIELSRKVGLNDFKLKKGFKELLGTTVFGYLLTLRMAHAKLLLEQKRSVSEVAHEVGYKNPHHFTAAFKKRYALLPRDINR